MYVHVHTPPEGSGWTGLLGEAGMFFESLMLGYESEAVELGRIGVNLNQLVRAMNTALASGQRITNIDEAMQRVEEVYKMVSTVQMDLLNNRKPKVEKAKRQPKVEKPNIKKEFGLVEVQPQL